MLDKATNPTAKRLKLRFVVGAMPDSSKLGRQVNLLQAKIEARDGCPCFCHVDGHPGATDASLELALHLADVVIDEASASTSLSRKPKSSELAGSSTPPLNFDPLSPLKRKAAIPAPADASTSVVEPTASTIVVEPTASTIVVEPTASTIVVEPTASTIVVEPTASTIVVEPTASTIVVEPTASTIVVEPTTSTIVFEALEQPANPILLPLTTEKKLSEGGVFYNPDVEADLQNREPKPFRDRVDQSGWTSGIGPYIAMMLMEQPEVRGEAEDHLLMREPPMGIGGTRPQPATVFFPTVGVDNAIEGGDRVLMPLLEIYQVEDPEQLGVDGLLR